MTVPLPDGATLRFRPQSKGVTIACKRGDCLVTQERDIQDHVLRGGNQFKTRSRGLVVVWSFSDVVLTISPACRSFDIKRYKEGPQPALFDSDPGRGITTREYGSPAVPAAS